MESNVKIKNNEKKQRDKGSLRERGSLATKRDCSGGNRTKFVHEREREREEREDVKMRMQVCIPSTKKIHISF